MKFLYPLYDTYNNNNNNVLGLVSLLKWSSNIFSYTCIYSDNKDGDFKPIKC